MKKLLSIALVLCLSTVFIADARSLSGEKIAVELDGKPIEFDVNPEIIDGRTMVPLRKIFEAIGARVKWNDETKTVTARKNSKTITLSIDSADLEIDKGKTDDAGNPVTETIKLEVPARIVSGRTLVPARAVSESFGLNVDWDEENQKVIIASEEAEDDSWKENVGFINLSDLTCEGEGIEIDGNQVKITQGGDFTVTGTLDDGNITISAKEKVKLRLSGAKITSSSNPCIFVEKADKAYITLSDGTENFLIAKNSEDGGIYSKENLEIKGDGSLEIEALEGHGIKASDNLTMEKGSISINATSDGIHINDTFEMSNGKINITAIGDGIDCESIVDISGGIINIETNGTPIETAQDTTETTPHRGMWEEAADVEFEKSTKGINAEWMMVISGGEININSASHGIHCQDEIEINGGKFTISSKYDKGISAHGNLTVNGADTVIDVTKSTEGIESKNIMTVNDGIIKVVSTDDAINATGGNSGMMMPGGNFGGGRDFAVPPENLENQQQFPADGKSQENGEQIPSGTRPQRGKKDRFQNMQPPYGMGENGEFIPPFGVGENGEFIPPFGMGENGEFIPPFGVGENGEFIPPSGMGENGEIAPPFGVGENGEFIPPFGMGENGEFTPPFGMGGSGRNMKTCLIINGGYFELCGEDDCIDANGNIIINGGTMMATNPTGSFSGNFGVIDPDGQLTIGENANIILASGRGSERSLKLSQNAITIYCQNKHEAGEVITISDSSGNVVYEYAPQGSYKAVLISAKDIKSGEKYTITIGNETFEADITQQATTIGTPISGGVGFGKGERV